LGQVLGVGDQRVRDLRRGEPHFQGQGPCSRGGRRHRRRGGRPGGGPGPTVWLPGFGRSRRLPSPGVALSSCVVDVYIPGSSSPLFPRFDSELAHSHGLRGACPGEIVEDHLNIKDLPEKWTGSPGPRTARPLGPCTSRSTRPRCTSSSAAPPSGPARRWPTASRSTPPMGPPSPRDPKH